MNMKTLTSTEYNANSCKPEWSSYVTCCQTTDLLTQFANINALTDKSLEEIKKYATTIKYVASKLRNPKQRQQVKDRVTKVEAQPRFEPQAMHRISDGQAGQQHLQDMLRPQRFYPSRRQAACPYA